MIKLISFTSLFAVLCLSANSFADDTELYVFESTARTGSRPQVLIIFDNSGSMRTIETSAEAGYNPAITYPAVGSDNSLQERMVYFTKGGIDNTSLPVPDSPSESRRFLGDINGCETSWEYLNNYGVFTGFFREYSFSGQNGTWKEVPDNNGANIEVIDCFDDIDNKKWRNAKDQPSGFPIDSAGTKKNPQRYTEVNGSSNQSEIDAALVKAKQTGFGTGQAITLYSDNYLRWYHGPKVIEPKSRIDIAKEVIKNTIVTTPSVDFGLAIFNINAFDEGDADGGRIISGIKTMSEANKITLLSTISNLNPQTNTPLCETLYESYRYFSGQSVTFGNKDKKPSGYSYTPNQPPRDTTIESGSNYISPFKECQNRAYVVYITDGVPTLDNNADSMIKALPKVDTVGFKNTSPAFTSYLPNLAGWMNNNDVNPNLAEDQNVSTYTIGFSDGADDAAQLLTKTAELGGGQYFAAKSATELSSALQKVFAKILEVNASFTSPSIASNNFDRTQTFEWAYYAMFVPNKGPRWMGNLKKFKVTGSGDIVDKRGALAISAEGNLKSSACSYWTPDSVCSLASDNGDGNDVKLGGVVDKLQNTATRKLYGNFASGGGLTSFTKSNAASFAGGEAKLAAFMGIDENQLSSYFEWAEGKDVDDDNNSGSTSDIRSDVMGDPLHSKPLALNFGTKSSPDIRVVLGTNAGFLHMFKDSGTEVEESWAFMPYELLPNIRELKANIPTGVHSVYGIDSSPVAYVKTGVNTVEKAWLFFGMRRGGNSYYALDITSPDSPKLLWKKSSDDIGMAELGQTWSKPIVTYIPGWPAGNTNITTAKPVIIIGAGYNPATKDGAEVGIDDTEARGVFILDAQTGQLVRSFTPTSGSNNTIVPDMKDSIPNSVAILDSNGDELTDRIYASDTGGNVWRIDLPNGAYSDWSAFKLASLGGDTKSTDRRFFAEPAVAQTVFTNIAELTVTGPNGSTTTKTYENIPYDAVVLGSGNRPHPSDKNRSDMFYVLQDRNVVSKTFKSGSNNDVPKTLLLTDLYDVTSAAPVSDDDNIAFGAKRGWYYRFGDVGEKSLASALIVKGRVFFTSYVPGDSSASSQCLVSGKGRLYGFDLHKGTYSYAQKYYEMGEMVPDTPQLVVPPNGEDPSNMYLIGIGAAADQLEKSEPFNDDNCPPGDQKCVAGALGINKIYYHINE
jgi:type IV pilus assembly protein PilY1